EQLAAGLLLQGFLARGDAEGGGDNQGPEPVEHAGQGLVTGVHAPARRGNPLQAMDDGLVLTVVLEEDADEIPAVLRDLLERLYVAFVLEDLCDFQLQLRGGD